MSKVAEIIPVDGSILVGKVYVVEEDNGDLKIEFDKEDAVYVIEALGNLIEMMIEESDSEEMIEGLASSGIKCLESIKI
jgi:hypothetical protein